MKIVTGLVGVPALLYLGWALLNNYGEAFYSSIPILASLVLLWAKTAHEDGRHWFTSRKASWEGWTVGVGLVLYMAVVAGYALFNNYPTNAFDNPTASSAILVVALPYIVLLAATLTAVIAMTRKAE